MRFPLTLHLQADIGGDVRDHAVALASIATRLNLPCTCETNHGQTSLSCVPGESYAAVLKRYYEAIDTTEARAEIRKEGVGA